MLRQQPTLALCLLLELKPNRQVPLSVTGRLKDLQIQRVALHLPTPTRILLHWLQSQRPRLMLQLPPQLRPPESQRFALVASLLL